MFTAIFVNQKKNVGSQMICSSEYYCLLLSVCLPCDNYANTESVEYIDYIEQLFNPIDCNAFICCGDLNS